MGRSRRTALWLGLLAALCGGAAADSIANTTAVVAALAGTPTARTPVLRVLVADRPPIVYIRASSDNSSYQFSGFLIDLLPDLLQEAGIDRGYLLYKLPAGAGGVRLANGTWTGVVGELAAQRADIALFPLTMTAKRAQVVDGTVAYMDAGYSLLVKMEASENSYSFFLPFAWQTWLLIIAALVLIIALLGILDTAVRRARYRAFERHWGSEKAKLRTRKDKPIEYASDGIYMLFGMAGPTTSRSWSVRLLFVCWTMFGIIMMTAYTANLTANLTVSSLATPLRNLADLQASRRMFGVPDGSSVSQYFQDSVDGLAASLAPSMIEYRDHNTALADLRAGEIGAYISGFSVLKGYAAQPPCDLSVSDETFGPGQLVIGLQKGSPLTKPLNDALLTLAEQGVLSDLRRTWFIERSACAQVSASSVNNDADGLTPTNVWPTFALLAGGVALSLVLVGAELLYYHRTYSRSKQLQNTAAQRLRTVAGFGRRRSATPRDSRNRQRSGASTCSDPVSTAPAPSSEGKCGKV